MMPYSELYPFRYAPRFYLFPGSLYRTVGFFFLILILYAMAAGTKAVTYIRILLSRVC